LLDILLLQSVAYDAMDNMPAALHMLQRAVELGAPQRYVRAFVEAGAAIQRLLSLLLTELAQRNVNMLRRKSAALQQYIASILAGRATAKPSSRRRGSSGSAAARASETTVELPPPRLTPRQRQVMRLIAEGASNEDIARLLVIALPTAKRHVSNIFAALDVR